MNANAEKKVFYVHGTFAESFIKNDSKHKLGSYRKYFTDKNGTLCWYDSDNNLHDIGTYCYNKYIKPQEVNNDIILVGHSMGGSVCRTMLSKTSNIKGLITAGTAHYGNTFFVQLANRQVNVFEFIDEMNNKSIKAKEESYTAAANALLSGWIADIVAKKIDEAHGKSMYNNGVFRSIFFDLLIPEFYGKYPCVSEMAENSNFNKNLNAQKINIPFINIYGAEDAWPFIRLLSTIKNQSDVNKFENIDKTYDDEEVVKLNENLSKISLAQDAHDILYDVMSALSVVIWKYKSSKELIKQARYNWDDLYRYIQYDMHEKIAKYNGSYQYEQRTYTYRLFGKTYTKTAIVGITRENDGMNSDKTVMLPESMAGAGGRIWNERALGANHMELCNHPNVKKIFENAYKGSSYNFV